MDPSILVIHAQRLIDLTLRYLGAGGPAILAFGAIQNPPFAFLYLATGPAGTEFSSLLLFLYLAVLGPTIYAIHRSVFHPLVLAGILYFCKNRYTPELSLHELDVLVADEVANGRAEQAPWIVTNDAWAAQIHFLYCAAWGITFALAFHYFINKNQLVSHTASGMAVSLALLVFALASDWRLNIRQVRRVAKNRANLSINTDAAR